MNVSDVDNDGFEDILMASNMALGECVPPFLMGSSSGFRMVFPSGWECPPDLFLDMPGSFGDYDEDGRIDFSRRVHTRGEREGHENGLINEMSVYRNAIQNDNRSFTVELVDKAGRRNQHGRVVRFHPKAEPSIVLTRIVDSGSGYLAQGDYPIVVGTPYSTSHQGVAYFADGIVEFDIEPGQYLQVRSDGTLQTFNP